jgi:hypothetical protein
MELIDRQQGTGGKKTFQIKSVLTAVIEKWNNSFVI